MDHTHPDDMPEGMIVGWKGPTAAMEDEVLYEVIASPFSNGFLLLLIEYIYIYVSNSMSSSFSSFNYIEKRDGWEEIMEDERAVVKFWW